MINRLSLNINLLIFVLYKIMKTLIYISFLPLLFSSCSKDQTPEIVIINNVCDSIPKSFANDVKPIFQQNCVTCHFSGSTFANGQSWETYSEIEANKQSILTAIKHESGKTPMPFQGTKLSDSLIQIIECWVADGAQNN